MAIKSSISAATAAPAGNTSSSQIELRKKALIWLCIIGAAILFFVWPKSKPQANQQAAATNYRRMLCPDAWQQDVQEPQGNHFTVKLHEGCFSGFIHPPKGWHQWSFQQVGNDGNFWDAFWFEGAANPEGPFGYTSRVNFPYHPATFRLQGKEGQEILFYTSDANIQPVAPSQAPAKEPPVVEPAPVFVPAQTVSKVDPQYTKEEAQRTKFSGTVTVAIVIDEQGDPQNIQIENPPGFGLDEKIIEAVRRWKFKPGTKDGVPISTTGKIQMKFRLS